MATRTPSAAPAPIFHRNLSLPSARTADTSKLWPVPKPARNPTMNFSDLVGTGEIAAIRQKGSLQFHAVGDAGNGSAAQEKITEAMTRDVVPAAPANGAAFFLNLGDIIYGPGKADHYAGKFYRPNMPYLRPAPNFEGIILAIPGNHDGEVRSSADSPTLKAYLENFCAPPGKIPPMAASFNVTMPHQPGPYWHLDAPFLDLIGLYTNSGENIAMLGADAKDTHQSAWLLKTLKAIALARKGGARKALVIATHHAPYAGGLHPQSQGHGHTSVPALQAQLDALFAGAGIWPDGVISGHTHTYQQYMRYCKDLNGRDFVVPYFVAGTGGMPIQVLPPGIGSNSQQEMPPGLASAQVVYKNGLASHGYLRITASEKYLSTTFVPTIEDHRSEFETVTIELASQKQVFI